MKEVKELSMKYPQRGALPLQHCSGVVGNDKINDIITIPKIII